MQAVALILPALLAASAPRGPAPLDCSREVAEARALFHDHASERLRFAAPLERAVRQVLDRALGDEERALLRAFHRGEASAGELDRRLWPKLRPVFARFNAADCRNLGGVTSVEETVDAVTSLRGGAGLHTSVLVTCAHRLPASASRRYVGLRVVHGEEGPEVVLHGVIEAAQLAFVADGESAPRRRIAVRIPLGDRAVEEAALREALEGFTGSEADFTWIVPAACAPRLGAAGG